MEIGGYDYLEINGNYFCSLMDDGSAKKAKAGKNMDKDRLTHWTRSVGETMALIIGDSNNKLNGYNSFPIHCLPDQANFAFLK